MMKLFKFLNAFFFSKRVHEKYLRNDISCRLISCRKCRHPDGYGLVDLNEPTSSAVPVNHALLVDSATMLRFHHVLSDHRFK